MQNLFINPWASFD